MSMNQMVRSIYHAEHYAMAWGEFYAHLPESGVDLPTEEVMRSINIAVDDGNYGGLGKFQSALDERVWETTMEGCEETGDAELDGHHCLVPFTVGDLVSLGVLGNTINFTYVPVGAIVTTMNSGAVDVTYYDTGAELDKAWAECEAESNNYSDESDAFLTFNRGSYHINLEGYSEDFDDQREAEFMLYLACHEQGYFPNCWEVNDHGNETLLFDTTEKVRDMLKAYVEFRDEEEAQAG